MQSEGIGQTGPLKTTHARTLDNHLPVQDKPGLRPVTWSHSQVTHVTCNTHWKCLPDLGVEVLMTNQQLSCCDITRPHSTRMYVSDTRYDDTWSPYG